LKPSYFEQACRNLARARTDQGMLFDEPDDEAA
jgi:hypothetical protein